MQAAILALQLTFEALCCPVTLTIMEQSDHLAAILTGDRVALRRLYEQQLPVIRGLIRHYGGLEAYAKDIFQDAVLLVYQKARQPDFQLSSKFSTYFYGICRNLWLNRCTKKSASSEVTLTEDAKYIADGSSLEEELLQVEQGKLFWRAFRQLGEDCQKILELFFQKTPMEAIATQMGFGSEGYAKRRKRQCKDRLTELAQNDPAYPELL
ncbi:MAG: RNA polymerase sigma factor [Saprospiraceae bacterium]